MLRVISYLTLTAIIVGAALHASTQQTHACSCVPPRPPMEALERADTVFSGYVVNWSQPGRLFGIWKSSTDPRLVEFRVGRVWKGELKETIFVETAWSEASCGFDFVVGVLYIVYARDGKTSLCSRTNRLDRASEDLLALGDGVAPAPGAEKQELPFDSHNPRLIPVAIGVGFIVIGLTGSALLFALLRRSRRPGSDNDAQDG